MEICSGFHSIGCMQILLNVTKCPLNPSSELHHHFWRGIRTIKVIQCPPNSSPQEDVNSNFNPNLKVNRTQTLTLSYKQVVYTETHGDTP